MEKEKEKTEDQDRLMAMNTGTGEKFGITDWPSLYWTITRNPGARIYGFLRDPELGAPEMDPPVMIMQDWNVEDQGQLYTIDQLSPGKFLIGEEEYSAELYPCHALLIPPELLPQDENDQGKPMFISSDFPYWKSPKISTPSQVVEKYITSVKQNIKNSFNADDRKNGARIGVTPIYLYLEATGPVFNGEIWMWFGKFTPDS